MIQVVALPEEVPVEGNAIYSGDEAFDRHVETEVLKRLERDDVWAWATVEVQAQWEGLSASEYLGCCCYDGETDFRRNSGYFDEMVDDALTALNGRLHELYERMDR